MSDHTVRTRATELVNQYLAGTYKSSYEFRDAIAAALAEVERETWKQAVQAIRLTCEACDGCGYGSVRFDEHGQFIDGDECEYCGRPMAALRDYYRAQAEVVKELST